MSDSPAKKTVLRAIRDVVQNTLHIVLIPVIVVLKFLNSELAAVIADLSKI